MANNKLRKTSESVAKHQQTFRNSLKSLFLHAEKELHALFIYKFMHAYINAFIYGNWVVYARLF